MSNIFTTSQRIHLESGDFLLKNGARYQPYIDNGDKGDGVVACLSDYFNHKVAEYTEAQGSTRKKYSPHFDALIATMFEVLFGYEIFAEHFQVTPRQFEAATKVVLVGLRDAA